MAILRAAARVFRERGYEAAGMREIAAAADVSPANLYHYFSGKHEILYFCQDRTLDRMLGEAGAAKRARVPFAERLRGILVAHVLCIIDDLEGGSAHLEVDSLPSAMRRKIITKRDQYERAVRGLVSDGAAAGEFHAADPALVARAILGALNGTARWFRQDGSRTAREIAERLADYLVSGLLSNSRSKLETVVHCDPALRPRNGAPRLRRPRTGKPNYQ